MNYKTDTVSYRIIAVITIFTVEVRHGQMF